MEPSDSLAAYPSYALYTLGELLLRGYLKKLRGLSETPFLPSLWVGLFRPPILVGLFLSISHLCGMIVPTANLVDSQKKTTEAEKQREPLVKGCQISPTAQAVPYQGWQQGATIAISPLPPEGSGALWMLEASVVR